MTPRTSFAALPDLARMTFGPQIASQLDLIPMTGGPRSTCHSDCHSLTLRTSHSQGTLTSFARQMDLARMIYGPHCPFIRTSTK